MPGAPRTRRLPGSMNSWFEFRKDRYPDPAAYKRWCDDNGVTVTLDLNRPGIPLNPSWKTEYEHPGNHRLSRFHQPRDAQVDMASLLHQGVRSGAQVSRRCGMARRVRLSGPGPLDDARPAASDGRKNRSTITSTCRRPASRKAGIRPSARRSDPISGAAASPRARSGGARTGAATSTATGPTWPTRCGRCSPREYRGSPISITTPAGT